MEAIDNILYLLSKLFYIPVVIALFLLLIFTVFQSGQFLAEAIRRQQNKNYYTDHSLNEMLLIKTMDKADAEIALENIIHEQQKKNIRKIHAAKYGVKIGPTAGLIGTLTPMAKALAGLSAGNMDSLSGQMITAFSTTVLGLVIGGIAYSIAHVRIKWQKADRYQLSLKAENVFKELNKTHEVS